jgi:diguanylate cyclase (GGDEF)-like protein
MTMDPHAVATALAKGALEIHYQPVVVLPSRHVIGFEALARLRDANGTLVPPADFIPAAEESDLIVALGEEVLRRAIAQAARWRAGSSAITTATVSVNIASAQLERPDIVDVVTAILAEHDVPGSALILEITESTVAAPGVRGVCERLSSLGIRVAIDDFGTGFATLDTLRRIPAQMLKLDRSFVAGVTREGIDRAIVRVVVNLADSLGLSVVAEGIETEEQAAALLGLGCAAMQGYLFAQPGPDPQAAADSVAPGDGGTAFPEREGPDRWPVALDGAVLAAARLLGATDHAHRGAVHAVAKALARTAAMNDQTVRAVGRLALVHDVRRLMVDGALPFDLGGDERLIGLIVAGEPTAEPVLMEIALVRAAVAVVDRTTAADPEIGLDALSEALKSEAGGLGTAGPDLRVLLATVALSPPETVPFGELMDDLDRRRMGRRGMEERMRSVFGITKVLSSSRDTRELMQVALEEVRRIVGAASASVERWERESNQLRCLVNVGQLGGDEETFPENEVYPLADYAQARRTMLSGLPYIHRVDDPTSDDDAIAVLKSLGKYSSAAVPIYVDRRIWGQLWFSTDYGEPHFEARDTETLMAVATLMGGVVVQAENLQRVDRMAFEDALTGVGNRRVVDDVLERLSARGEQTVVALLDMDRLKEINDLEGHASGDAAIQRVADALSTGVASWPRATVGRLGGDEFCVILPLCPVEEAHRLVTDALTHLRDEGGPCVSVGLAATNAGGWAPRDLLAAADDELYKAKRTAHASQDRANRRRGPRLDRPRRHISTPTPL